MDPINRVLPRLDAKRSGEVRQQLDRLLSDPAFSGASRRSRLLRYLVEESLEDRADSLKESVIAAEVFDRPPDYDPQVDSVVRVEVGRLRARLAEYYAKANADEPVRIEIPRGNYRPAFVFRDSAVEPAVPAELEPASPAAIAPRNHKSRAWWLAVAAAAVVLATVAFWRLRTSPPTPASIAVMPFLNLSGDPADEYLSDGISEELTEDLAEFNELRVVARTSAFQYKAKSVDVREIGRNLRAGALLEGSVTRRGGRIQVIAQLIRTSDGYHMWSHTYDAVFADLPPVEAGIAKVTREKLAPSSAPLREFSGTRNPEAHDLYMRAAYELNRHTPLSTQQAIGLLRQATEKDPFFAQPFVALAAAESQLNTLLSQSPHAGAQRAREDIDRALALDPANSAAHAQRAILAYTDEWDWPKAEREFRLAVAAGSHGSAENLYGWCLLTRGRFAEARERLQLAAELDPLSLGPQLNQVEELIAERNYAVAREKAEQILHTAPLNPVALALATSAAFWQRDCAAATAWSSKFSEAYPLAFSSRLRAHSNENFCEHPGDLKSFVPELLRDARPIYVSPYTVAAVYAAGNDADNAVSYLQKSSELREPVVMMLKVDRAFDSIRQDARLLALERKIGLLD